MFAFCLAKESQHFDVLPHPCTKIQSFCQVNSFPIFQATIGTSGKWFDPWHVDISFGEINQNLPAKRAHDMSQRKLLKSNVLWEWFWNIYQVNEIYQSTTQITGELIKIFFLALLVRGYTRGKLLLSARLVLFSGALVWKIQLYDNYKLENIFWLTVCDIKNPSIICVLCWNTCFMLSMLLFLWFTLFYMYTQ